MSIAIIGTGITALWIARCLQDEKRATPVLFEKSRGVGGRMATRRTDTGKFDGKFDHGAQFYSLKAPIRDLHARWGANALTRLWFDRDKLPHFCSQNGMNGLAKDLAKDLDIRFEQKVTGLTRDSGGWKLVIENGEAQHFGQVILTAPLPQALELLQTNAIPFDPRLREVRYAKALVALYEDVAGIETLLGESGYIENPSPVIFSIADQCKKGLAVGRYVTITMTPDFSERYFDSTDMETLAAIEFELKKLDPRFSYLKTQLKKWRYSHPLTTAEALFESPASGLFLAGDAFGGPSLNGALRSANALMESLRHQIS